MKKQLLFLLGGLTLGLALMWFLKLPSPTAPATPAASAPSTAAPESAAAPSAPISVPPTPSDSSSPDADASVTTEEKSTEKSALPTGAPSEICQAPNAQEAWYRLSQDFEPKIEAKNFYFEGKDGRTLLIRQAHKSMGSVTSNTVVISANWYDRDNKSETLPKELAAETRFLEPPEIVDLAGPAWFTNMAETPKLLVKEEVLMLRGDPDQHVTLRNGVAVGLHLTWKNFRVDCGMNESCACVPVKVNENQ